MKIHVKQLAGVLPGNQITYGSIGQTACEGNDARLSDARTPTLHSISHQPGGTDPLPVDAAAAVGSLRRIGVGALQACSGADARLSDSRTPLAHATSHQPSGSDPMAVNAAAAVGSLRSLGTGALQAAAGNDARLSDARTPIAHKVSHQLGGTDQLALDATQTVSGTFAIGRLATGTPDGTKFVRDDGTLAVPPGTGGFDINALTAITVPAAGDFAPEYNLVAAGPRKITWENTLKVIHFITALGSAPAIADEAVIYNIASSAARRQTLTNFFKVIDNFPVAVNADRINDKILVLEDATDTVKSTSGELVGGALMDFRDTDLGVATTAMTSAGLSLPVKAAGNYAFEALLKFNYLTATGLKTDLDGGGATMANIFYSGEQYSAIDGPIAVRVSLALATDITWGTLQTDTDTIIRLHGSFSVSGAGTVVFRFSRTGGAGTVTLKRGSWVRAFNAG